MRKELLWLALGVALTGCKTDDTGDTDVGSEVDTEVDSDTDTDSDSDTMAGPECGDGTVDPGEQCDDGDANGADPANCSEDCEWNGFVTCDVVSGDVLALPQTIPQPDGSYHIAGRFSGTTALASDCAPDSTQDVAVTFELPSDGTFVVTTDHPGTTVATALSLRTDCDVRSELSCNAGNSSNANGSKAVIEGGISGDTYVAIVHNLGAADGGWQLSVQNVAGAADIGEACDDMTVCADGLCSDGMCADSVAPVLDAAEIAQISTNSFSVTLTGSDANLDATVVQVPSFTDIVGDVWGDQEGEDPIVLPAQWSWDGADFTAKVEISTVFFGTGLGDIDAADFQVVDAAGQASGLVSVTVPAPVSNEIQSYIGDSCDMCLDCVGNDQGFPNYCDGNPHADPNDPDADEIVGLYCVWDDLEGTGSTCQDKNLNTAPTDGAGFMSWRGEQAVLDFSGYDNAHSRGMTAIITAVYTDGTSVSLDNPFTPVTWDIGTFMGQVEFETSDLDETLTVDFLEVALKDATTPNATMETPFVVTWVDPVDATVVLEGEECDLFGYDTVCEEPFVCSPSLSGIPACADSEAPILYSASGQYQGGFFAQMTFTFEAEDANADWYALMAETATGRPSPLSYDGFDSTWMPSPFGSTTYSGQASVGFADWMYNVWLQDADGNESSSTVVVGVPTDIASGEACNTGVCNFRGCSPPVSYCDVSAGDTCSDRIEIAERVQVCETAEAPVLDSITVLRTGSTKYKVEFTGSDTNGDASSILANVDADGEVSAVNPVLDFTAPLGGAVDIDSNFTGTLEDPLANHMIDVTIKDFAFLRSDTLTAMIPPLRLAGEECSGDDTIDRCQDGSECQDGTCFAFEPSLTDATISWDENRRDAVITVTGSDDATDADTQLRQAIISVGGLEFTKSLSSFSVDWDGNDFTFEVDAPGLGTGALIGEQFLHVEVIDVGNFSDDALYFITPQAGWMQDCDADESDGVDVECHAGLVCDVSAVCVVDEADACAGIPLTMALGTSGGETVAVTTANGTGTRLDEYPDYATCGADNRPNGREAAIEYVATQDGTLTITSADDPSDGSVIHGHLYVRLGECVNYDAIATCDNSTTGANSVSLDVQTGDVIYVMVDGGTFPSGGPVNVTFSY